MTDPLDSIPGWFTFGAFYDRVVRDAPRGSLLIEVGVWMGRSLCHLARAAKRADKGLRVLGVDWFCGSMDNEFLMATVKAQPYQNMAGLATWNLYRHGLGDVASLLVAESEVAARLIPDGSAHMVFIDGSHDTESVRRDIGLWMPKVEITGIMAGHDADSESVRAALNGRTPYWRHCPEDEKSWELA